MDRINRINKIRSNSKSMFCSWFNPVNPVNPVYSCFFGFVFIRVYWCLSVVGSRRSWFAAGALLWLAATAGAQPIRIPDFRESPRVAQAPQPGEKCEHCGVVRSVSARQSQRPADVPQAFQNQPIDSGMSGTVYVGAVVYVPLGKGTDKPFVGGVGTPEMRERFSQTTYEIAIQLDTGGTVFVQRDDGGNYRTGDRVRVQGNQLELLVN